MITPGSTCVAPLDDIGPRLCGAPATVERLIADIWCPLCADHAAQIDLETDDTQPGTELGLQIAGTEPANGETK